MDPLYDHTHCNIVTPIKSPSGASKVKFLKWYLVYNKQEKQKFFKLSQEVCLKVLNAPAAAPDRLYTFWPRIVEQPITRMYQVQPRGT